MANQLDYEVAIIGAGLGGLAAAYALSQLNLHVAVFERSAVFRDRGGALAITPNGLNALEKIDPALHHSVIATSAALKSIEVRDEKNQVLFQGEHAVSKTESKYGKPIRFSARHRLHQALLEGLPKNIIKTDHRFLKAQVSSDSTCARVLFEGRKPITVGLILGADGIHSQVRNWLLDDGPPKYTGVMVWLGNLPAGDYEHLAFRFKPMTEHIFKKDGSTVFGVRMVGTRILSWSMIQPTDVPIKSTSQQQVQERARQYAQIFPEPVQQLVRATKLQTIYETGIYDREPTSSWGQGPVTLLGDAAHPMSPLLGQGANMAFEDALELAQHLAQPASKTDSLRRYEKSRIARTAKVVRHSLQQTQWRYRSQADPDSRKPAYDGKNGLFDSGQEFENWLFSYPNQSTA